MTKNNDNQPKGENKTPKIINTRTGKYRINQLVYVDHQEDPQRVTIGKCTINKHVNIIYQEDPKRILINKENILKIRIIKSIKITYLFLNQ